MSQELKIALIASAMVVILLFVYIVRSKKRYGKMPLSTVGVVLEAAGMAAVGYFYYQYTKGLADIKTVKLCFVALAVAVVISVFLNIIKCKKMGMGIAGIIIGAFAQVIGVVLIVLSVVLPAIKAVGDDEKASRKSGPVKL